MTTMMTEAPLCTSCRKQKNELKRKESRALPGKFMFLCKDCLQNKREPRGYVVLAGRSAFGRGENGLEVIKEWVKPHQRYLGEEITIRELI